MPPRLELNLVALVAALGQRACHFDIDLLEQCDSTNSVLLARAETGAASGSVVVARAQNAGRGRRGRAWISAVGDSLTFSLLWRLPHGVQPAGLSLAAGLAVARALEKVSSVGAGDTPSFMPAQLKWPNDILLDGRKLGGILVELLPGATHGSNAAVIGCGINLRLPAAMPDELRAQSAAVSDVGLMRDAEVDPNTVLAALLIALRDTLEQFTRGGFASLQAQWMAHDAYADKAVRILSEFAAPLDGICRGVNTDGALRLEVDGKIQHLLSGEVSLRPIRYAP
ncbi:MAG: biotin--[acetyl-CoA-carboxylase] ligase [Rhodocyclaceae bacterium]|nr:biotin--[acetyl-CoA-carboxylase] ligase [Rhodocyclaceae bacterium]